MNNRPNSKNIAPKPYELIPFPQVKPSLGKPAGHHKYHENKVHGTLYLALSVETAVHVSTGVVAMGNNVGQNRIPLIKTMMQDGDQNLIIPGSSLKGVVRSIYEAITNSTLGVISNSRKDRELVEKIPKDRHPCPNKEFLCPASRIFGARDWQGLISFSDAVAQKSGSDSKFMPNSFPPRPKPKNRDTGRSYFNPQYFADQRARGRKFYYNFQKAITHGNSGIETQQASTDFIFETKLGFSNLKESELGALLVTLGVDKNYPMALKIGGGKHRGMGTMIVKVTGMDKPRNIRDRYLKYDTEDQSLTEQELQQTINGAIAAAHQNLIQQPQLKKLQQVLTYPTNRKAPEGNY